MRDVIPVAILLSAAVVGGVTGLVSTAPPTKTAISTPIQLVGEPIKGCRVVDGDTLRCGGERVRLLAIDAPEMPGHCQSGRNCAPGDPLVSTASLVRGMVGNLRIERIGQDHYGRTLALMAGSNGDLSCWQLRHGQAVYKPRWDNGGRLAAICTDAR